MRFQHKKIRQNTQTGIQEFHNLIKISSSRSLLNDLKKSHIKIKSGDLSIMDDHNVMPRRKLSSDYPRYWNGVSLDNLVAI